MKEDKQHDNNKPENAAHCEHAHDASATEILCDAIIQVAILRGDFVRGKER